VQGVDRWQLRVQRAADKQLDEFEVRTRESVFTVPEDMQLEPPGVASGKEAAEEAQSLEAESAALWAQLQTALATKRELKRKVAAAENVTALWEAHRDSVQQLAAAQQANGAVAALDGTQRLRSTLQQGWTLLGTVDGAAGATDAAATARGPRGLQQRFAQRRFDISTVSVPDLGLLSQLLCAS
jgi:phage shock protein A